MTNDEKVIGECLRAAVEGPFFPDWEFHALFGLERKEVAVVLASWPEFHDVKTQRLAVNNALVNLLWYPSKAPDTAWHEYISVSPAEVRAIYERWRGARLPAP
ncbi:hypothetical protein [Pyxidicoccus trucidator]|uniref:hypothetical protein n=1 Tax=Pyxidicoccus trucidator TaxID=2709662 RepID=UPI0019674EEE|nr:hypothetical protein [Pyxidicoccus trucidator]